MDFNQILEKLNENKLSEKAKTVDQLKKVIIKG